MENSQINSIGDLRSEIIRLQAEVDQREILIRQDVNDITEQVKGPLLFIKKVAGWFGGIDEKEKDSSADWFTSVMQLGFPFIVNNLFFRRSGLIMKGLIALISQKAVSGINLDTFTGWVNQLSDWIKGQSKKKQEHRDYGIPPDSETY